MSKRRVRFRGDAEVIDIMLNELHLTGFSISRGPVLQGGISKEFVDVHLSQKTNDHAILCRILCNYAGYSGRISAVSLNQEKPVEILGNDYGRLMSIFRQYHDYSIFTRGRIA